MCARFRAAEGKMLGWLFGHGEEEAVIPRDRVTRAGAGPVSSTPEFQTALTRHYARSDRTGRIFTLLIMDLEHLPGDRRWAVAEAATDRARATDHVGWFDGTEHLGAILYNCDADATRDFAYGVLREAEVPEADVSTRVHSYPGPVPTELEHFKPEGPPPR